MSCCRPLESGRMGPSAMWSRKPSLLSSSSALYTSTATLRSTAMLRTAQQHACANRAMSCPSATCACDARGCGTAAPILALEPRLSPRYGASARASGGGHSRVVAAGAVKRDSKRDVIATSALATRAAHAPAAVAGATSLEPLGSGNGMLPGSLASYMSAQPAYRSLVLDSAYRPINVATWFRAFNMAYQERAEVISVYSEGCAWSGQGSHPLAAVIRVFTYVDVNDIATKVACSRRNVMIRDRYTCVYCGCHHHLTLDHVMPLCRGGKEMWTNLVTACTECNQRKGSHTLQTLGWRLKAAPWEPTPWELGIVAGLAPGDVENPLPEWADYLEPYRLRLETIRKQRETAGEDS